MSHPTGSLLDMISTLIVACVMRMQEESSDQYSHYDLNASSEDDDYHYYDPHPENLGDAIKVVEAHREAVRDIFFPSKGLPDSSSEYELGELLSDLAEGFAGPIYRSAVNSVPWHATHGGAEDIVQRSEEIKLIAQGQALLLTWSGGELPWDHPW